MSEAANVSAEMAQAFASVTRTFRGKVDDIYELFARKRVEEPVMKGDVLAQIGIPSRAASPDGKRQVYSLFRHADIQAVMRDNATYSSSLLLEHLGKFLGRILTGLDGAEHRAVRSLVQPAFTPAALQNWRSQIMVPMADQLIADMAPRGRGELFGEAFIPFPMYVIYRMIGFPDDAEAVQRFAGRALSILCGVQVEKGERADEARRVAAESARQIAAETMALIQQRRHNGGSGHDLISSLVAAESGGESLSDTDIAQFVIMLLPAAAETTTRTLSNLFALLLQHPDQLALLQRDRSLIPRAIAEAVRFEPVPMYLARLVTRDVCIGGVDIPAGSSLSLVIGSANRDEAAWERADQFDIQRPAQATSLGFGTGVHMCLGMFVARAEMEVLVSAILDRLPGLRADPAAPPVRITGGHFRGPENLPVVWDR